MRLEQSEAELFYQSWIPLLDLVNRKYHVCPATERIEPSQGVDPRDAKTIADYLWSHTEVIEEYLAAAKLPTNMLKSWQAGNNASRADIFWNDI